MIHIGRSNFSCDIRGRGGGGGGGGGYNYAGFDTIGDHDEKDSVERNRMIGRIAHHQTFGHRFNAFEP